MIGSFIDRMNARVCYGSSGGPSGGDSSGKTTFFSCVGAAAGTLSAAGAASKGNMKGAYGGLLGASAAGALCVNGITAALSKGAPDYNSYNAMGDYSGR